MALSAVSYAADGIVTDFVLSFTLGYLRKEHIQVEQRLDGETDFTIIPNTEWIFINQDQGIRFNVAPVDLSSIRLRRITPNNLLIHDYEDGSLVIEENLDESNKQAIMLMHEAIDGFSDLGAGSDLDMAGLRITNLGTPISDGDAVNFGMFNLAVPAIEAARDQGIAAVQAQEATSLLVVQAVETSVQVSETNVNNDAISVTNTKASFDAAWLGDVGVLPDPTLENEGTAAVLTGVGIYIVRSSAWVPIENSGIYTKTSVIFDSVNVNITTGQTVFNFAHTAGNITVLYNGSELVIGAGFDYTDTGSSFTLTIGVTDDTVDTIEAYYWS